MKIEILRNLVLRYGSKIGLKHELILFIWHVLDFDFRNKGLSWPGQETLAARMGYKSTESIRKLANDVHRAGWFIVEPGKGRGQSTRYHVALKLIDAVQPFYEAEAAKAKDKFKDPPTLFGAFNSMAPETPTRDLTNPQQSLVKPPTPMGGNSLNKIDPENDEKIAAFAFGVIWKEWTIQRFNKGYDNQFSPSMGEGDGLRDLAKMCGCNGTTIKRKIEGYLKRVDDYTKARSHPLWLFVRVYSEISLAKAPRAAPVAPLPDPHVPWCPVVWDPEVRDPGVSCKCSDEALRDAGVVKDGQSIQEMSKAINEYSKQFKDEAK